MRWRNVLDRVLVGGAVLAGIALAPGSPGDGTLLAAAQAQGGAPYRVFVAQAARTPTPTGARCNDQSYRHYTGPNTCAGHGGIHYWIYS